MKEDIIKLSDIKVDIENIHLFTTRSGPRNPKIVWNGEFKLSDGRHFIITEDTLQEVINKMMEIS
jgi:hypothetical protein